MSKTTPTKKPKAKNPGTLVDNRPVRESKVERELVDRVAELGGVALKFTSPGRRGVPDRLILWPRTYEGMRAGEAGMHQWRVEFVETKAKRGVVSKVQERNHDQIRKLGHVVNVLSTFAEVASWAKDRTPLDLRATLDDL